MGREEEFSVLGNLLFLPSVLPPIVGEICLTLCLYKGCFIVNESHVALADDKETMTKMTVMKNSDLYFLHSFHLLKIHFTPCNVLGLLRDT